MHQVDKNVERMTMGKKVDQGMATLMGYKQENQQHNQENFKDHRGGNIQEDRKTLQEITATIGRGPDYPQCSYL